MLKHDFDGALGHRFTLRATDNTTTGVSAGTLAGHATLSYDPTAQTVTVRLTASGLTPGGHAVHIHVGSCQAQGAPKYMPMNDFVADQHGNINDTRVITGVTSDPLTAGFYLNLHQGDSMSILVNGAPALSFRPLLCANL